MKLADLKFIHEHYRSADIPVKKGIVLLQHDIIKNVYQFNILIDKKPWNYQLAPLTEEQVELLLKSKDLVEAILNYKK